ncbi:MAG: DUF1624 domain-containing protein [Bacilli bacterium]|jgi:uncharacterized membrane protein|nr:DUF1624 domain-containing protein [Bacilli bacterium]
MEKEKNALTKGLSKKDVSSRVWEIDFLRCIPIFLVMLYHLCYDFSLIPTLCSNYDANIANYKNFGLFIKFCNNLFYGKDMYNIWVPFFAGIFLFLCGVSTSFSRNNIRRGLLLWLGAGVVTLATYLYSLISKDEETIVWGILQLMAFTITFYALIELFARKVLHKEPSILVPFLLAFATLYLGYLFTYIVQVGGGYWPLNFFRPVNTVKDKFTSIFSIAIGKTIADPDWWPILPYSGVIFLGIGMGRVVYGKEKKSIVPKLYHSFLKPFCFIGRHTIWFYLGHQVVFIPVLTLVCYCMGFQLSL